MQADGGVTPCWNGWFKEHDAANWHNASLAFVWNSVEYQRLRLMASRGGSASGGSQCDRCAYHRNFVPTPDCDNESLPDRPTIDALEAVLATAGARPSRAIREAVLAATDGCGARSADPSLEQRSSRRGATQAC